MRSPEAASCCSALLSNGNDRPMSALGQKQTCTMRKAMSALPPIATAKADIRESSCRLYPRKRHWMRTFGRLPKDIEREPSLARWPMLYKKDDELTPPHPAPLRHRSSCV